MFPNQVDGNSPDMDLLSQLQHQGAATGLIDFTHRSLIALWFACHESHNTDGAFYILNRSDTKEITNREVFKFPIAFFYKDNTLWSWDPTPLGKRIEAQGSVFVFGCATITSRMLKKIVIKANCKRDILDQLREQHGIHEENVYPDFDGYASANAPDKPFDIQSTTVYWRDQIELSQSENQRSVAYYNCGVACGAIRSFGKQFAVLISQSTSTQTTRQHSSIEEMQSPVWNDIERRLRTIARQYVWTQMMPRYTVEEGILKQALGCCQKQSKITINQFN